MANTLTNLIPDIYAALNVVSREMVGMIPSVTINPVDAQGNSLTRAAVNENIRVPVVPAASGADITPAATPPDTGDQTIDNVNIQITKARSWPVRWTGEESQGLRNANTLGSITQQRFEEAFRAATNEIETDLCSLYTLASRAHGTAGTAPFGTANSLADTAGVARILDDNGAPVGGRQLVLGSAAWQNLRGTQSSLFKVNEAGTAEFLREGFISQGLQGFALRNSKQVVTHTKGTGSGYLVNDAAAAIGDTSVVLDTGSGTVLAGDVVTFAGQTDKMVVKTGVAAPGTIVLNKPGQIVALADNAAMTIGDSHTANMAFTRGAIVLVTRLPAMPDGGDMADDAIQVTDPVSGITFEIRQYKQYHRVHYSVEVVWGYQVIKPEHVALLLG